MCALIIQQGCDVALETLHADMEAREKDALMKEAYSTLIICLGDRVLQEVTKETYFAGIWTKLTSLYMTKSLANTVSEEEVIEDEDWALMILMSLTSSYENFMGKAHFGESSRFKSSGEAGKLKCFICHLEGNMKRDYLIKKLSGFVKKGKQDQDSNSFDDEGNAYIGEAYVVVGNDEMIELVINLCGPYHVTHGRDFLYNFKVFDGGLVQLVLRRSLISLGTLEKEGYIVKIQMARVKVSNDDVVMAQRWLKDKQLEEKTNTDCLVKEHEKSNVAEKKKVKEA
ncbi:hypothetical protein Tco_1260961 [Tanacetum coccineum]